MYFLLTMLDTSSKKLTRAQYWRFWPLKNVGFSVDWPVELVKSILLVHLQQYTRGLIIVNG